MSTDSFGSTVELAGSSRIHRADVRRIADVAEDEQIEISIYLNSRTTPDFSNDGAGLAERRAALRIRRTAEHDDDIRLLEKFAAAHHLTVSAIEPERRLVKLTGTASSMQAAFRTKLGVYHDGTEQFRSHAGPIWIPSQLGGVVQAVLGLDNRLVAKPHFVRGDLLTSPSPRLPNEFGLLYRFPNTLTGAGQCIAILEFSSPSRPCGFLYSDIDDAFSAMNLPTPTIFSVPVGNINNNPGHEFTMTVSGATAGAVVPSPGSGNLVRLEVNDTSQARSRDVVEVSGVRGTVEANGIYAIEVIDTTHIDLLGTSFQNPYLGGGTAVDVTANADGEVALDIQVAGGVAPAARQAVYFAPNNAKGFADAISQAATDQINNPSIISISWGLDEERWLANERLAIDGALADAASIGVSVFASSGDLLSTNGETDRQVHVLYPASSPWVISCGGTQIDTSGNTIIREIVWNTGASGTGGGISRLYPIPQFQSKANLPKNVSTNAARRGVPDVAGNASPDSGYTIYVTQGNLASPQVMGGTSAVAPLWAGLTALLNEAVRKPIGFFLPMLYENTSLASVITDGNNCPSKFPGLGYGTGPGWSGCTGLGSPIGGAWFAKVVGLRPFVTATADEKAFVLFRNSSGNIVQAGPGPNWTQHDLNASVQAGQPIPPPAQGTPCAGRFGPSWNNQLHVLYRDVNNHISDIWGGAWFYQDLNAGTPKAADARSDPFVLALSSPDQLHVLYRDANNHISDFSGVMGEPGIYTDLNTSVRAGQPTPPPAQGTPCAGLYGPSWNAQMHVFYRDVHNHISDIWGGAWFYQDLNSVVNNGPAPDARSDPFSVTLSSADQIHVLYRDAHDHISDLSNIMGSAWVHTDLNASVQAGQATPPPAQGAPCAVVFGSQIHVLYRDVNNHISDIWGGAWFYQDLNAVVPNAPAAKSDPFCFAVADRLIVTYLDVNDHIALLNYSGGWRYTDLTTLPVS